MLFFCHQSYEKWVRNSKIQFSVESPSGPKFSDLGENPDGVDGKIHWKIRDSVRIWHFPKSLIFTFFSAAKVTKNGSETAKSSFQSKPTEGLKCRFSNGKPTDLMAKFSRKVRDSVRIWDVPKSWISVFSSATTAIEIGPPPMAHPYPWTFPVRSGWSSVRLHAIPVPHATWTHTGTSTIHSPFEPVVPLRLASGPAILPHPRRALRVAGRPRTGPVHPRTPGWSPQGRRRGRTAWTCSWMTRATD